MSFLKWLLSEQFYNNDKRKKGDCIIGDLAEEDDTLPPDVQLISVVDCVGKVTTNSRGNTIPNN